MFNPRPEDYEGKQLAESLKGTSRELRAALMDFVETAKEAEAQRNTKLSAVATDILEGEWSVKMAAIVGLARDYLEQLKAIEARR